jgi:hypothetical protein
MLLVLLVLLVLYKCNTGKDSTYSGYAAIGPQSV